MGKENGADRLLRGVNLLSGHQHYMKKVPLRRVYDLAIIKIWHWIYNTYCQIIVINDVPTKIDGLFKG